MKNPACTKTRHSLDNTEAEHYTKKETNTTTRKRKPTLSPLFLPRYSAMQVKDCHPLPASQSVTHTHTQTQTMTVVSVS